VTDNTLRSTMTDYGRELARDERDGIFAELGRGKFPLWHRQRILLHTWLFGKEYFWMQDPDDKIYLLPVGEHGLPDISRV
jgi:hypothetical protein